MGFVYNGCVDRLYVLGSDRKTYARDMFYARDPHRAAEQFIAERDGIAAVMTLVGKHVPAHTWGVSEFDVWVPHHRARYATVRIYYFPGAEYGIQLLDDIFVPLRRVRQPVSEHWVYCEWPAELPRPKTIPFADSEFWIPNLR